MAPPLISIVLLCYNHEHFVAEAIQGILSQTYSPLEIIIVDDCSTDRTAEVIERTIEEFTPRAGVRFVRNPGNIGGYATADAALRTVKGDFVFISCGDDVMLPEMVSEMANAWKSHGVSLVTANAYYIDEQSKPLNRTFRDPTRPGDDSFETLVRDGSNACCFGAALGFEREIYARFGWPPAYLSAYDIMFPFYAYLLKGARFLSKPLLKYRLHSKNTSLSLEAESSPGAAAALVVQEEIFFRHLAHAFLMETEVDRLNAADPARFSAVARAIKPLIGIQATEMARKLTTTRIALNELGITRLSVASADTKEGR
jgi:glycosyltransferase involved in cell wall biosynthesis